MIPEAPAIEKSGDWMVIVVTDSKGRISAYPMQGRDKDEAFLDIDRRSTVKGSIWMVHWEKGLPTQAAAQSRAQEIEIELKAKSNGASPSLN